VTRICDTKLRWKRGFCQRSIIFPTRPEPYPFNKAEGIQRKGAKARRRKEDFAHAGTDHQMVSFGAGANFAS
jgi:hypothetical protein